MELRKEISYEELNSKGGNMVFKLGHKQILLLEVEGKYFALDNRCPHEGYPLSQGSTDNKSCVLTCNWHNWKFDLKSGECLLGGDNVRTYPISVGKDFLTVDASDKSPEEVQTEIMEGLKVAFDKRQYGRLARELARLHYNGLDPKDALRMSVLWSFERFEFGTTHAYAALADWLAFFDEATELEDKIIALTEAIDHIAFDGLRHQIYPYARAMEREFNAVELIEAVEKEHVSLAESMVAGAFDQGMRFRDLEKVFTQIALAHYNDFGHSLIYVQKSVEVVSHFDCVELECALALALIRSLAYATREDLLPEFKNYASALEAVGTHSTNESIKSELLAMNTNELYDWCVQKLSIGLGTEKIYSELLVANAASMLGFETSYGESTHNPVSQNVSWLDFTHALTFSNAVRTQCLKYPSLWPQGLLQMASFLGRNKAYRTNDVSTLLAQWTVADEGAFKQELRELVSDHGNGLPIFSAHILKTSVAVLSEVARLSPSESQVLLASLNRFVHSPIKQKHVRRLVHQGINLVKKDFE